MGEKNADLFTASSLLSYCFFSTPLPARWPPENFYPYCISHPMESIRQRQVFPEDVLHALATLETFRHLAAAGIDDELGLEAGTIRHMARLDASSIQAIAESDNKHQDRSTAGHQDRRDSGVVSDIEVNLDGKLPARVKFKSHETMFDASSRYVAQLSVKSLISYLFDRLKSDRSRTSLKV